MKKLICLVGETACGKDTVARYLQKKGLKAVCSWTDRPMRPKETDGKEHWFISKQKADELLKERKDDICAYTQIGDYRYWAFVEDLQNADIYIIDPQGIKYLKAVFPHIPLYVAYVTAPLETTLERAKERGDDVSILENRIKGEREQFFQFRKNAEYDTIIVNHDSLDKLYENVEKWIVNKL